MVQNQTRVSETMPRSAYEANVAEGSEGEQVWRSIY